MRKLTNEEIKRERKKIPELHEYERNPIYVVLDNVRSIFNVGSIFRTSDSAFVEKLYLTGYTAKPPRPEIDKVALGATLSVPWEYRPTALEAVMELKEKGVKICVIEITDEKNYLWNYKETDFPVCLVMGNELTGVAKEVMDIADIAMEIPMYGFKQSLNVSVAYGIAVYELVRKLKCK